MAKNGVKYVSIWLIIGLILIFVQVLIGGITRLTDSGLSITEWEVIKGVIPPTNEAKWQVEFEKYQQFAAKQFNALHQDMTLQEFKIIYFWEWFHRLWARSMGIIFLIPFLFFVAKKWMPAWLAKHLILVVALAALAAVFGIIMVFSGLNDDTRTWVSAYKLVIHLSIATALFGTLYWTYLKYTISEIRSNPQEPMLHKWAIGITLLVVVQIAFGGLMAGMRAGAIHPHWPFFLGDNYLVEALISSPQQATNPELLFDYEKQVWIKAVVQVFHRVFAYLLFILSLVFIYKTKSSSIWNKLRKANWIMLALLLLQVLLGILTIVSIVGSKVPVFLGVVHQGTALLLFLSWLYITFQFRVPQQK